MKAPRPWLVVSGAMAFGLGSTIGATTLLLNDGYEADLGAAVALAAEVDPMLDPSPESPDSPFESAQDSVDSPFDSPDDPGFLGSDTTTAVDSPATSIPQPGQRPSPVDTPAAVDSPSPAPQPASPPAPVSVDSPPATDTPAPAPQPAPQPADSPDGPDSPHDPPSVDSAD